MGYSNGQVSVGTTATLICTIGTVPDGDGVLVANQGTATIFLGGPGVTTSTGLALAQSAMARVPTTGAESVALYGVVATGTQTVGYLFPG